MQNQLLESKTLPVQQIAAVVALVLLVIAVVLGIGFRNNNPYSQKVLALQGDPTFGHAIFQMNCSGCHGLSAQGRVGPNLQDVSKHKSRWALIEQVTSGNTPPMPQFHPSPREMADLLSYLETL